MRRLLFAVSALLVLAPASWARAADFYLDPVNGSMANDGSRARPWGTLAEVVAANLIESQRWASLPYAPGASLVPKNAGAPVQAGDTLWLMSGYHGDVDITGYYNAAELTIAAAPGETPRLSRLLIRAGKNWKVVDLSVSPDYAPTYQRQTMIAVESHGYQGPVSDVTIEGCTLMSKEDVSAWTMSDWDTLSANGISAGGDNITIRNNRLKYVNFGISVTARASLVEGNVVDSFSGDGLRGLGDDTVFQYNTVKNCYDVNENHDDGFQSWSVGAGGVGTGEVKGIVLRGNVIINYEDPNQPFRGTLQGIGCFDGTYTDWVVENNVIITDHWHGITFLGAKNVRVVNNTVLDPNTERPGPPWISIDDHKDGTPPEGCLVRNNLVTDLNLATSGVTEDHNMLITDAAALFVDVAAYDVHLLDDAPAVDQGSADLAPATDLEGVPRPQGAGVDLGAYEWHVDVVDGGVGIDGGEVADTGAALDAGDGGVSIPDSGVVSDAGSGGDVDGGSITDPGLQADPGCGCRETSGADGGAGLGALLVLVLARRRRSSR
ncbi:MAG: right-handed parallel beta-helix repeat-containing protein [Deltaproteobacteria bacterium]|nr:right-handed parallel beta-helix repeat-containing protein [Deltaproteobacteria bacterium]